MDESEFRKVLDLAFPHPYTLMEESDYYRLLRAVRQTGLEITADNRFIEGEDIARYYNRLKGALRGSTEWTLRDNLILDLFYLRLTNKPIRLQNFGSIFWITKVYGAIVEMYADNCKNRKESKAFYTTLKRLFGADINASTK